MKGGGLTWVGWLAVGLGSMLVYAGMTGQSLVAELSGVLTGKGLVKGAVSASGAPIGGVTDPANHPSTPGGNIPPVTGAPVPPVSPRVPNPSQPWATQ
jgi:hypothetical protein